MKTDEFFNIQGALDKWAQVKWAYSHDLFIIVKLFNEG